MFHFIGPVELLEYISRKDVLIVDLRDKEDYEESHIKGAINIPYEAIMERKCIRSKDKTILLYCERGNLSLKAALKLDKQGYKVCSLNGGIWGIKTFYDN